MSQRTALAGILVVLAATFPALAHDVTCPRAPCTPEVPGPEDLGFDGDSHGDAGDACGQERHDLPLGGEITGTLLWPVDPADVYRLTVPASRAGTSITVTSLAILDETGETDQVLRTFVREPACGAVVASGSGGGVTWDCLGKTGICRVPHLSGDSLTFTAGMAGDYTVVVEGPPTKRFGLDLQGTDYCDPVCSRTFNAPVGYRLAAE